MNTCLLRRNFTVSFYAELYKRKFEHVFERHLCIFTVAHYGAPVSIPVFQIHRNASVSCDIIVKESVVLLFRRCNCMPELITLDMDHPAIQYLCKKDKRLAKVINMVGPISYTPHDENPYAFLIHEIIEQMLSVKAGRKIYSRLEDLCDGEVSPERINSLSDDEIHGIGTSSSKVKCIRCMTNAVLCGDLDFDKFYDLSDEKVMHHLTRIHGIGKWTAKMYLLFVLERQDILPVEDGAFLQTYRWVYKTNDCSEKAVYKKCKKWKPYSSIASRYFYRALDAGMTKKEFHLFL